MPKGVYRVYQDPNDKRDIVFEGVPKTSVSSDQSSFVDDVERTLALLRGVFPREDDSRFDRYFKGILLAAQRGLVGDSAVLTDGKNGLSRVKDEIARLEGPRLRNHYLEVLGLWSVVLAGVPLIFFIIFENRLPDWVREANWLPAYWLLWSASLVGTWISFAARNEPSEFENLHLLTQDWPEPIMRLCLSGIIAIAIGLFVSTKAIGISLGPLATWAFESQAKTALLLGFCVGIGDRVLVTKILNKIRAITKLR